MKHNLTYFITAILIVFTSMVGFSQENEKNANGNIYGLQYKLQNLEGQRYLQYTWSYGTIFFKNGEIADNVKLRFNIVSGELIFYHEKYKTYYIADRNTFDTFILNKDYNSFFQKYSGRDFLLKVSKGDFVERLYESSTCSLVVKHGSVISLVGEVHSKDKIYPRKYYVLRLGNDYQIVKPQLRSLVKTFPDQKKEIRKIAREIHFRKKSVSSMTLLFEKLKL